MFEKIQKLLHRKLNLNLTHSQIKNIPNKEELVKCLEKNIPIEFEWTFIYTVSIFDQTSEGAKNYISQNLELYDLELNEIIWNPSWQII